MNIKHPCKKVELLARFVVVITKLVPDSPYRRLIAEYLSFQTAVILEFELDMEEQYIVSFKLHLEKYLFYNTSYKRETFRTATELVPARRRAISQRRRNVR